MQQAKVLAAHASDRRHESGKAASGLGAGIAALNIRASFGGMLDAALRARMIDSVRNATSHAAMSCRFLTKEQIT
jgi:hypothetical protein